MIRSGRMRSAFLTSSRWRISLALEVRRTRLQAADVRLLELQFRGILMVIRRSLSEMCCDSALSNVVLPEPVPPEMSIDRRQRTAVASRVATGCFRLPASTRRSSE